MLVDVILEINLSIYYLFVNNNNNFNCQGYLALIHSYWGHCKLKLIQIKFNQIQVFEERENQSTREKTSHNRDGNQQTQPTHDARSGNRTRAPLVGGGCSHHHAITAFRILSIFVWGHVPIFFLHLNLIKCRFFLLHSFISVRAVSVFAH